MSTEVRKCRVCGCTDEDCRECIAKTGRPCWWVSGDLCSACRPRRFVNLQVRRHFGDKKRSKFWLENLVSQWNELPVGVEVRFYPVWGRWAEFKIAKTREPASLLPSGEAVLWLEGVAGCVSARHCEPASLSTEEESLARAYASLSTNQERPHGP